MSLAGHRKNCADFFEVFMKLRQEENSPVGDFFHDSGATTIFNAIASTVDEFEVDSDQLSAWCTIVINDLKGLQSVIKKMEKEAITKRHKDEADEMIHRGAE